MYDPLVPGPGTVRASGLPRLLGVAVGCATALAFAIPGSAAAGTVSVSDPAGDVEAGKLTSKERAAIDIKSFTVSGEESLGMLATVEFAGKFTKLIGRGHLKKGQAELELQPSSPDADPARLTTKGAGIVGKTVRDTSSKKVGAVRDGNELTFFIFGPGFSSVANAEVSTFARRSGGAVASQETGAADTAGPLDILPRPLSCDELKAERDLLRRAIDSRKEQRAVVEKALDETNEAIKKKEASVKLTLLKLFRKLGITRPAPIEESIKGLKEIREGLKKQLDKLNHDIAEFERELEKIEARIPAACAAGPSPGGYDEFPIPTSNSGATDIASQNPLWFTEQLASKIGMATTDGAISDFGGLSGPPTGIAVAGGKIWATVDRANVGDQDRLARFSSAGCLRGGDRDRRRCQPQQPHHRPRRQPLVPAGRWAGGTGHLGGRAALLAGLLRRPAL